VRTYLGIAILMTANAFAADSSHVLGPPDRVHDLQENLNLPVTFIVRGTSEIRKEVRGRAGKSGHAASLKELPLIDGVAAVLLVKDALKISKRPGTRQVWYVAPALLPEYITIIQGIDYSVKNIRPPSVLNMSLGPRPAEMPIAAYEEEPMNQATRAAADKGFVSIFAAGNYFDGSNPGVINPWCRPVWVVCVGAASGDAGQLWSKSARGSADDQGSWPTVVAHGIDVISTWPSTLKKSDSRRSRDEGNAQFIAAIPPAERDVFTIESGTSQAVPQVSRAASQIIHFLKGVYSSRTDIDATTPLFSLEIPLERFEKLEKSSMRLTGVVARKTPSAVEINYHLVEPWRLVKQLLIDTSISMPAYQAHEVGAGFVSPDYIEKQFGQYGIVNVKTMPVKVTAGVN
jgi:hypothetical protein